MSRGRRRMAPTSPLGDDVGSCRPVVPVKVARSASRSSAFLTMAHFDAARQNSGRDSTRLNFLLGLCNSGWPGVGSCTSTVHYIQGRWDPELFSFVLSSRPCLSIQTIWCSGSQSSSHVGMTQTKESHADCPPKRLLLVAIIPTNRHPSCS